MKGIATPPGLNERLLHAIQQEIRPLEQRQAETEQYLHCFRIAPLPLGTQTRILAALHTRRARTYRRLLAAVCAAVVLMLCVLLYPVGDQPPVMEYLPEQQPAYTVHDAADRSSFSIKAPVVFVADEVL